MEGRTTPLAAGAAETESDARPKLRRSSNDNHNDTFATTAFLTPPLLHTPAPPNPAKMMDATGDEDPFLQVQA